MKKFLKSIAVPFAASALCFGFVACSDDDDDNSTSTDTTRTESVQTSGTVVAATSVSGQKRQHFLLQTGLTFSQKHRLQMQAFLLALLLIQQRAELGLSLKQERQVQNIQALTRVIFQNSLQKKSNLRSRPKKC